MSFYYSVDLTQREIHSVKVFRDISPQTEKTKQNQNKTENIPKKPHQII